MPSQPRQRGSVAVKVELGVRTRNEDDVELAWSDVGIGEVVRAEDAHGGCHGDWLTRLDFADICGFVFFISTVIYLLPFFCFISPMGTRPKRTHRISQHLALAHR